MVLCVKCIGERAPCKLFCKHCVCLASHADVNIKRQAVRLSVTLLGRSTFNTFSPPSFHNEDKDVSVLVEGLLDLKNNTPVPLNVQLKYAHQSRDE